MPVVDYLELECAYEASSFDGGLGSGQGLLNVATGATYWFFEETPNEEPEPEDLDDPVWHRVPSGHELDLGRALVSRFVEDEIPAHAHAVRDLWHGRGAWRRWKDYLDRHGLLERWFAYERAATIEALVAWCADLGVEVTGVPET